MADPREEYLIKVFRYRGGNPAVWWATFDSKGFGYSLSWHSRD